MLRATAVSLLSTSLLVLAACTAGPGTQNATGTEPDPVAPVAVVTNTMGGIQGIVTDESLVPIGGATVLIAERFLNTTTDPQGRFAFSLLDPGTVQLDAEAAGHHSTAAIVTIVAGYVATITLSMASLPVVEPYHKTLSQAGFIACSLAYKIPGVSQSNSSWLALCGVPDLVLGPGALDRFSLTWSLQPFFGLSAAMGETTWESTQTTGKGLHVRWWVRQEGKAGERGFQNAYGPSPLRAPISTDAINATVANASGWKQCGEAKCSLLSSHYAHAYTLGQAYPIDFGVVVQQRYEDYLSLFYWQKPAAGFSALPDA